MHFAILQVPSEKLPLDYFFGAPVPSKMYETTWERESLELRVMGIQVLIGS